MSQSPCSLAGRSCERGACGAGSAPQRHTARLVDTRTSSEGTDAWALHAASCCQVKLG